MTSPKLTPAQWRALEWLRDTIGQWASWRNRPFGVGKQSLWGLLAAELVEASEHSRWWPPDRGCSYRITDAGCAALAARSEVPQ